MAVQLFEYGCRTLIDEVDGLESFAFELDGDRVRNAVWINDTRYDSTMTLPPRSVMWLRHVNGMLALFSDDAFRLMFGPDRQIVRASRSGISAQPL